jgi:hypothetical protein
MFNKGTLLVGEKFHLKKQFTSYASLLLFLVFHIVRSFYYNSVIKN